MPLQKGGGSRRFIGCLSLSKRIWGIAPLYLVDNTEPVTSQGVAYTPCAFTCLLPEQNDDGASKPCRVEIDNVDRHIAEKTVGARITLTVSVGLLSPTPGRFCASTPSLVRARIVRGVGA